jgi:hypothetical protein
VDYERGGIMIDHAGFEAAMQRQRERAPRASSRWTRASSIPAATEFRGYDTLTPR